MTATSPLPGPPDRTAEGAAERWPIAALMLWAGPGHDEGPDRWSADLAEVRRVGFTAVDVMDTWVRAGDLDDGGVRDLAGVIAGAGLVAPALSTSRRSPIDRARGAENLGYLHRTIDAAAALGIPLVSVGLFEPFTPDQARALWFWLAQGPVNDPADRPLAVHRLRELADHAAYRGIAISLEMYEDTFLGTADSAVALLDEVDRPNVGLNPDVANLVRLHRRVEHWRSMLQKTLPLANYWHVKNYARDETADGDAVATTATTLRAGIIDYRWAVRFAIEHGFTGPFAVEHNGGDALGMIAEGHDYLRSLLPWALAGQKGRTT